MGIMISKVKIRNFRSIQSLDIDLQRRNIFVGQNNAGKSNILQAIALAFDYSSISKDDVYRTKEHEYDKNTKVVIDVYIIPVNDTDNRISSFDDEWNLAFGTNINFDEETDNEYFSFRTTIEYNDEKGIYKNSKYKIDKWRDDGESKIGVPITHETIETIEALYINAQRDISLDIRDKKSIWGNMISKIKIADEPRKEVEAQLKKINQDIVNQSELLTLVSEELSSSTADKTSKVEISPVTREIESLYKGMDIYYTGMNSTPISVENLGQGVRSWAVFSTVKAQATAKAKKYIEDNSAYLPLALIEEPEAHIHPHAQRQLFKEISDMDGQKLITTHSPYILSQIDLKEIKYVKCDNAQTRCFPLIVDDYSPEEIRKIKRVVMNTRGELLYANAVILAEGETEEQALPIFFRHYFGKEPFEMGINFVAVNGNNYITFVRLLERLGIPWFIFSDGESNPLSHVKSCIKETYELSTSPVLEDYSNVVYIPNNKCIEEYYLDEGYLDDILNAIDTIENETEYIVKTYIPNYNDQKAKGGKTRNYLEDVDKGVSRATIDYMCSGKTKCAPAIAEILCQNDKIPVLMKKLFEVVKATL